MRRQQAKYVSGKSQSFFFFVLSFLRFGLGRSLLHQDLTHTEKKREVGQCSPAREKFIYGVHALPETHSCFLLLVRHTTFLFSLFQEKTQKKAARRGRKKC